MDLAEARLTQIDRQLDRLKTERSERGREPEQKNCLRCLAKFRDPKRGPGSIEAKGGWRLCKNCRNLSYGHFATGPG